MRGEGGPAGHPELWTVPLPDSRGPEENFRMWQEAEDILDGLCTKAEEEHWNAAALQALVDAYNRCIEERRRAGDLMELHHKWSQRPIGGVQEPESPVRD